MARWSKCRNCGATYRDAELVELPVTMGKYTITIKACPTCRENGLMDEYAEDPADLREYPEPDYNDDMDDY